MRNDANTKLSTAADSAVSLVAVVVCVCVGGRFLSTFDCDSI